MPIRHLNSGCPQTVALWTINLAAFCKGDINGTPHYAVTALMAKITSMIVSLLRDAMVKACRSSGGKIVEAGGNLFK
jgi:hypothetical protein